MNNLVNEAIKKILSLIVGIENKCEVMQGATSSTSGKAGVVPAPPAGDAGRYLRADGTWVNPRAFKTVEVTLLVDSWVAQDGAYVYDISNSNITATNDVVITPKYPISGTLKKLDIINITQTVGNVTLTSSIKPDADIAITMYIYKEG